jgi:aryl-alcohol dehydrogenase-like predicted oxidoreductase
MSKTRTCPRIETASPAQLLAAWVFTALLSATDAEALAERLQAAATEYSTDDVNESWP